MFDPNCPTEHSLQARKLRAAQRLLLPGLAGVAMFVAVRKAMRVDPLTALRSE